MRELARSDPVRPQDRWTRKLDEVVWPKRRGVFGRYGWVQREFDESKHPRVPAGSPAGGQFGSGGGGEQGELWPGKFPKSRPKKKVDSVADFEKDKVHVVTTKPEKFLEAWNDAIGIEPGEFHKQFTGGLKSTMEISHRYYEHADGDVMENELQINGKILDENDRAIGTYTREIDLKNNVAESSYFALNSGAQGKGEGKQMLAANVAMYQELGLDKVKVHANIDVGGYAWAKYGYVPTEDSWDTLRGDLREKLDHGSGGGGGGEGYTPEEWDSMTSDNQDSVEQHWRENARDDIAQSEEENWRESGQALNDAKQAVADQYNVQSQWANNAIDKVRAAHDGKLPFDNEGILQAVSVEYDPRRGDGRDDPEFTLTENDLPPAVKEAGVSDELWSEIEEALLDSFNGRADDKANEMDPPDNLVDDALDSYWEEMRSRDKFSYAEEHGLIEDIEDESSDDDGEPLDLNPTQETLVRKLLDNDDPKAIWALSDTAAGKQLLLGSDWNGAIDFHDKETMARFNAYVGKQKTSAQQAAA